MIKDRITGVCIGHLFLAINKETIQSKKQMEEISRDALQLYHTDARFQKRVNDMVEDISNEIREPNPGDPAWEAWSQFVATRPQPD
ncbi:MAG TPA: hypothetical protein VFB72_18715 [Verrucomicrobiae bacterium]|nr:hypothetical protein [Verrucomicrobiae bacterium]